MSNVSGYCATEEKEKAKIRATLLVLKSCEGCHVLYMYLPWLLGVIFKHDKYNLKLHLHVAS